jgi:CspA family cold shock protein
LCPQGRGGSSPLFRTSLRSGCRRRRTLGSSTGHIASSRCLHRKTQIGTFAVSNPPPETKRIMANTISGTIKRITDKGFGFIAAGDGTEYFFHQSAVTSGRYDDLREGQKVSFTVGQGPKGPRAENVRPE